MSVKKNVAANYLGQGWTALMGLIFVPVYIKYLGAEAYGLIGVFSSLQAWLVLLDMGLAPTLNREMARFKAGAHTAESINNLLLTLERVYMVVAALILCCLASASPWLAARWLNVQQLDISTVECALQLTAFIIAFRWMATLYRSAITGLQCMVWLNVFSAIFSTLRGAGVIAVLAFVSPTIEAFFCFQLGMTVTEVLCLVIRTRGYLPAKPEKCGFSWAALKSVWSFAAGMMLLTLLSVLITQIDKLMLSRLLSLENFGYFTLATTLAGFIIMLTGPICNVALPKLSEAYARKDQKGLEQDYSKFTQLLVIFIIPASLVISVFSQSLLMVWTHDEKTSNAVSSILSFWVVGTGLNAIMHMPYYLQIAAAKMKANIISSIIVLIIIIPLYINLIPRYGAMGAAYIWIGVNASYFVGLVYFVHKSILENSAKRWYIRDVITPSILPVFFVVWVKMQNIPLEQYGLAWQAIGLVGVYLVSFALALMSSSWGQKIIRFGLSG